MKMKNPFNVILLVAIALCSCSTISADRSSKSSEIKANDYLVYLIEDRSGQRLMFYDVAQNINTPILENWDIVNLSISIKDRLAISSSRGDNAGIYVLDYPFTDKGPRKIISGGAGYNSTLSWSPDGLYLSYEDDQDNKKFLAIWDGKASSHIHQIKSQSINPISELTWSQNDQLAFTEFNDESDPAEVFVWDGHTTTSVSQNPYGEDRFPAWSADRQLAFLSNRNGKYDIFVWDGESKVGNFADVNKFTNIAPELTNYYSEPVWTNSNFLTFEATGPLDLNVQIYKWDGKATINISNNPFAHNGDQTWRSDGYWSFVTFFSDEQRIYVRDNENRTILSADGQYVPAWSQSGILMFCTFENDGWTVSMWDGAKVTKIAHGGFIQALWRNGNGVFCSSG